jgi:hypothetical protein
MRPIVLVTGGGGSTGGAELMHQLSDVLVRAGLPARLLYYPFHRAHEPHPAVAAYKTHAIRAAEVPADALMVFTEVSTYRIAAFPGRRVLLWWLSVDNYFGSRKIKYWLGNRLAPWTYLDMNRPRQRDRIDLHLYQSEYARLFLEAIGAPRTAYLGDYINQAFVDAGAGVDLAKKQDILLYNPAKGLKVTRRLLAHLPPGVAVPIAGMPRAQVIDLLARAKVYIDFGHHPGQDRIPREAATLGCCVITNRQGSAGNDRDIPIPDAYKIAETAPDFTLQATALIGDIFADFASHHGHFAAYRQMILAQKARFETEAVEIFRALT